MPWSDDSTGPPPTAPDRGPAGSTGSLGGAERPRLARSDRRRRDRRTTRRGPGGPRRRRALGDREREPRVGFRHRTATTTVGSSTSGSRTPTCRSAGARRHRDPARRGLRRQRLGPREGRPSRGERTRRRRVAPAHRLLRDEGFRDRALALRLSPTGVGSVGTTCTWRSGSGRRRSSGSSTCSAGDDPAVAARAPGLASADGPAHARAGDLGTDRVRDAVTDLIEVKAVTRSWAPDRPRTCSSGSSLTSSIGRRLRRPATTRPPTRRGPALTTSSAVNWRD